MIRDLQRMVDDFRAYTQGIVKDYHFTQLDLTQIIQQAETLLFLQTEQAIAIDHVFPDKSPVIHGDTDRLQQVFNNLLTNATQAIAVAKKSDGRIEIKMTTQGNIAEVRIKDNGPGIPVAVAAKLFSSYVSTKNGGMGLGLLLVHEILRRHGGKIEYNAKCLEGAEFIMTLPVVTPKKSLRRVEV
jgi:signal transduction histidine kinase